MLVLTRKRTEKIMVGDDVVITVIHTSKGNVKLGIQAPAHVRVLRAELDELPVEGNSRRQSVVMPSSMATVYPPDFSADRLLGAFDSDDMMDMENQLLTSLAK